MSGKKIFNDFMTLQFLEINQKQQFSKNPLLLLSIGFKDFKLQYNGRYFSYML